MRRVFAVMLLGLASCQAGEWVLPDGRIVGTWGGDNAGVIATDSSAHVHFGCESGNLYGPMRLDAHGGFEAAGEFVVGAYPVGPGTRHPALFRGAVFDRRMSLTVQLTDTTRTFGPVALVHGEEPRMGPCPICRRAPAAARAATH